MEQIPYYFEIVNRTAIVISPRQPFVNWIKSLNSEMSLELVEGDHNVYLIPDFDETAQMNRWLKKNFDLIFIDQLNNWYTDETYWIKNRTFKMFKEWFNYSLHTMVLDTLDGNIEKI